MRRVPGRGVDPAGAAVAAVYLGFVAVSLMQQPGRTTYDTRLELTQRPGAFLASAFSFWQPDVNFGEVQNQANGYLFPQGPFFWLADLVHAAPWLTQRVWSALVVIAACEGLRRVCRAVDLPPSAAFLGGLVFAFSPRLLGTSGVLSAEALPGALAPWALLPILLAARGRLRPWHAAVLSTAAVVAMGGVNAVETAAALVPTGVLILWAAVRGVVSWRLVAGWVLALAAATLWWTVPLLVLSRYSPSFYKYVESAATTTSLVGWSEAIRGDTHWLSWLLLPDGRPWWPAAHSLATDPVLVAVTAVIAAVGLTGLARWQNAYRVPFMYSAAVGLMVLTIAHGGVAGSPLAGGARSSLDGVLQIFRNVHKIDPAVRMAVAVGVAALFAELVARAGLRRAPGTTAGWVVIPCCVVLVLGTPYLLNEARTRGWSSIPASWVSARDWLAAHGDGEAALVVPGSGFALQDWGDTFDEPALALDVPDRVALTQAPLLPGPSLRFLSALNASITAGTAGALADQLAHAGIGYVVVRGDLDQVETGSPNPAVSEAALQTAGIEKAASFGAYGAAPVTVYRVERQVPRLRASPVADVRTVAGEPESVLALQDAGVEGSDYVLQGEPGWRRGADIVTDGAQRRERQFGSLYSARSVAMQAGEPYRVTRAAHDYPGVPGARQVVAAYDGLASLRASSSRGYADTYGDVVLAEGPAAAIDGNPATRWVTSPASEPTRQWLRLTFTHPRVVRKVTVQPVIGDRFLAPVRRIEVSAGSRHQPLTVAPDGAAAVAHFDGRPVSSVVVRITQVGTADPRVPVALADVRVDDLVPRATLKVPEPLGPDTGFVFRTDAGTRPCVGSGRGWACDENRRRAPEEWAGMDRTIQVRGTDTVALTGSVVARTTRRAIRLLAPVGRAQRVRASSILGNDPQVAGRFAWDGDPETAWIPADRDRGPTLLFRWSTPRRVSAIRVTSPDPAAAPGRALLTAADGRQVAVGLDGAAPSAFPAMRTRRLEVTLQRPTEGARMVVGEVALIGADVTQPFDRAAVTGAICGLGPHVVVDGVVHQSEVRGTLGDIVDGRPLRLRACDVAAPDAGTALLHLDAGQHRISAPPTAEFQTVMVAGIPPRSEGVSSERTVELKAGHGTLRTASVGPGPTTLLSMPANANPGWRARLGSKVLEPVRVDGWQQGWVLPAGPGGRLVIDFPPQGWYGAVVVAGLVPAGAFLMAALLILLLRRRGHRPPSTPEPAAAHPAATAVLATVLAVGLGGACAIGLVAAWIGRRRAWPLAAGGLAVLASGLLDVRDPAQPTDGVADVLAAVGFGLLFVVAVSRTEEGE